MDDRNRWWNLNNPYAYRNDNLRRLGFKTYRSYLKSDLWASIRERVFERADRRCERCKRSKKRLQVHHRAYDPATLAGTSLDSLTVTCSHCHRVAEDPRNKFRKQHDRLHRANHILTKPYRKLAPTNT